jgi:hypothetical protein
MVIVIVVIFGVTVLNEVPVVLVFHIADVEEAIASDAEVDERGLDAGFDIDDAAFVDVTDVVFGAAAFDVKFFEDTVFDDCNPAFFRLQDINEHFLFHDVPGLTG